MLLKFISVDFFYCEWKFLNSLWKETQNKPLNIARWAKAILNLYLAEKQE